MKNPQLEAFREGILFNAAFTSEQLMDMKPPKVPFIVNPWLIEGQLHLFTGYQGQQKSTFSLWLAKQAVKAGRQVVFVDLENDKGTIIRRFHQLQMPRTDKLHYWADWRDVADDLTPPPKLDPVYLAIADTMKPVIIFDSLNRFHSMEENSNTEMAKVTEFFHKAARNGATIWLIHQAGKPNKETGKTDSRGASEIGAAVDIHWHIGSFENLGNDKMPQNLILVDCPKVREFPSFSMYMIYDSLLGQFHRVPGDFKEQRNRAKEQFRTIAVRDTLIDVPGQSMQEIQTALAVRGLSGFNRTYLADILQKGTGRMWSYDRGPHGAKAYYVSEDSLMGRLWW